MKLKEILQKLFGKPKLIEPPIKELNNPHPILTQYNGDKMITQINGVWFEDKEKIHVKYCLNKWNTGTLLYKPYTSESNGWVVMDDYYDTRPLDRMESIGKMINE